MIFVSIDENDIKTNKKPRKVTEKNVKYKMQLIGSCRIV